MFKHLANFQDSTEKPRYSCPTMKHKFSVIENGDNGKTCCGCCFCSKRQKRAWICILLSPIAALVILIIVLLIRAATLQSYLEIVPLDHAPKFMNLTDGEISKVAKRLGEVIQIRTISYNTSFQVGIEMYFYKYFLNGTFRRIKLWNNCMNICSKIIHICSMTPRLSPTK